MHKVLVALLGAALLASAPGVAPGEAADTAASNGPFLVLETGVHEAAINAMAPLADNAGVVTVSDDKTARLWGPDGSQTLGILLPLSLIHI